MKRVCMLLMLCVVLGCVSSRATDTAEHDWMVGTVEAADTKAYVIFANGMRVGVRYEYKVEFADGRVLLFSNQPTYPLEPGEKYVVFYDGDYFVRAHRCLAEAHEEGAWPVTEPAEFGESTEAEDDREYVRTIELGTLQ